MPRKKFHKYDDLMIPLLARGETQANVATLCACGISTVQRRFKDPAFVAMLNEYQASLAESALAKLSTGLDAAVKVLHDLLDEKHPAGVRLTAGRVLFDMYFKVREAVSYEKRLSALEDKLTAAAAVPKRDPLSFITLH